MPTIKMWPGKISLFKKNKILIINSAITQAWKLKHFVKY